MQEAQRASYNHALEHAVKRANELEQPLVCSGLHKVSSPVVSEWRQKSVGYTSPGPLRPMGE